MGLFWHSLRRAGITAPVAAAAESGRFRRVVVVVNVVAGIRNASSSGSQTKTKTKNEVLHRRQNAPQQRQYLQPQPQPQPHIHLHLHPHQYQYQYPLPVSCSRRNLTTQIAALAQHPLLPGRNQPGIKIGNQPGIKTGKEIGTEIKETRRSLSFYGGDRGAAGQPNMGNAAYTVYGEEAAFGIKAIPPEFRALPSGTVVLDASKRGRFLFEWTPMDTVGSSSGSGSGSGYGDTRKFRWDSTTRFALTAEEAGSLLARLDRGDPSVEFSRRMAADHPQNPVGRPLDKVFVAKAIVLQQEQQQESSSNSNNSNSNSNMDDNDETRTIDSPPKPNGISLLVDYVDPDQQRFGQIPHPTSGGGAGGMYDTSEGFRGPFEIRLMIGEYHVLRSILEESIPKLVGWTTMFDRNIEQAIAKSLQGSSGGGGGGGNYRGGGGYSPHNYQGGGGGSTY